MFAPSPRSSPAARRRRQHGRAAMPLSRSGSILNSLKSFVSAPLSWFGSNDENVEDLGKRRRSDSKDIEDVEEDRPSQGRSKRARVGSPGTDFASQSKRVIPSTSSGYLDPPSSSLPPFHPINAGRDHSGSFMQHSSTFTALPSSISRTMSIDPPTSYSNSRLFHDPSTLSMSSPIEPRSSMSVAPRELSRQQSSGPLKLRSSLTPQPSSKPLRREASAPPPLASLQSRPVFVRPPEDEQNDRSNARELRVQKTMSLGAYADFNRGARAPSRDKTLTNTESIECGQSAASDASKIQLKPIPSITEKTFKDLEVFKTPIVPSRYKDAEAVPGFLRSNKSHVPIPMSKKDRIQKPSLGFLMPDEGKGSKKSRHAGKPYGKRGGISKVLERRRAEEEEGRRQGKRILEVIDEDDEMEMDAGPSKRDVGVSTGMLSSSEDEHIRANKDVYGSRASDIGTSASSAMDDPFKQQKASLVSGGRAQPYGRIGRTRTRDPGHRSVPLGRSSNRFAATFDDDDDMDPTKQDTDMQEEISSTPPVFEAPKNFSFAQNTKPVEHDHDGAKEPPLQSLPFSFVKPADTLAAKPNSPWIDTTVAPKPDSAPLQNPPDTRVQAESLKSSTKAPSPPLFSSSSEKQDTEIPRTNAAKSDDKKPAAGVPNFFANSPLLASKEKESTAPPVSAKSAVPFSFGQPPSSATPSAKEAPALATGPSNATASTSSPFSFGAKVAESGPKPLFGAPAKAQELGAQKSSSSSVDTPSSAPAVTAPALFAPTSEPHSKPAVDATKPVTASPFSFGTSSSASSTVPKPLFGFGSPSGTTPTSTGAAQSFSQNQSTVPRSESKSPFAFGATNTGNATSLSSATATSEQKPMFTFGAATKAPETSAASSPASNVVTAPKPLFGQPSSTLTFNFGNNASVPSSAPATEPPKSTPSPFAFGAPPATPPAVERQASPFNFGAQAPSSSGSMFTFGAKPSETTAPASAPAQASTTSSPFSFGTPQRPITPPSKPDEGMNMEESPNRMDTSTNGNKPGGTITFGSGVTPANPFGQPSQPTTVTTSPFTFGQSSTTGNANPFGQKVENNFTRTSSAPAVSTTFSFGAKPTQPTPPATAFGTPSNPFSQPPQSSGSTSSPFSFGQPPSAPAANPFGAPSQPSATTTTPSTPFGQSATTFSFGAPSNAPPNPFAFGSQPSSPATIPGGLPQSPATTAPQFTFGAPSSATASPTFNMGPPPPPASGTPTRQMKKLPNRARPPPRR